MSRLWHPFADMASVKDDELVIARGRGARVWDDSGREYIDAKGGLWYSAIGHGRGEIADAVAAQMRELESYDVFASTANRPALELAERVSALAPFADGAVFFASGGSDAVDTAGKLALRYWHALGREGKRTIAHRERSYHGMNAYGTSLAGIPANREGFGSLIPDGRGRVGRHRRAGAAVRRARRRDRGLHRRAGDRRRRGLRARPRLLAARAGAVPRPRRAADRRRGDLRIRPARHLVRLPRFGITPDLITCAKGITSGYLPLGAVVISPRVQEPFWTTPGAAMFRHGYTYSGHPSVCAAGLANLDILEREGLLDRVARLEPVLAEALAPLTSLPLVSEVRSGVGLLAAVELDAEARAADPGLVERAVRGCRDRGVLTRGLAGHSLQVSPPFVIDEDEIARVAEVFTETLSGVSVGSGV